MKHAIVFICLVATVLAASRVQRQLFGDQDPAQVYEIMKNPDAVKTYVECVVATDETKCDKVGKKLRATLGESLKKGDCATACNEPEKKAIVYVFETIKTKYPEHWETLKNHFKPTEQELKDVEAWIASVPK